MKSPEDKVLKAIMQLEHDPNFIIYVQWLIDAGMGAAIVSTNLKDVEAYWKQGESKTLLEIAKIAKNARQLLGNRQILNDTNQKGACYNV